jgi:hypothetical protein
VKDLIAKVESDNSWLTMADLKTDPPIETVAEFEEALYKARDLNLKTGDGNPVVAFSGADVSFNFAGIFGFTFFRKMADGTIHSYYGGPYAKDFYKTINKWYRDGVYDKDIYLLKNEQLVQKISNGEVAFWPHVGPSEKIQESLLQMNPEAYIRPMPLPWYKDDLPPYIEDYQPGPGQSLAVNTKFQQLEELIDYLDWLYSDQGQELAMWGDGEGTIWKVENGKNVFLDESLYSACLSGAKIEATNGKTPRYYGLLSSSPYTLVFNKNKWTNPYYYKYSYPNKLDGWKEVVRAAGENGIDSTSAYVCPIPKGEYAARANNFFWSQSWDWSAKMFLSKTDEEFENNWKTIYDMFMKEVGDYSKLQEDMAPYFP